MAGRPKGAKNIQRFPEGMYTTALYKAIKRIDHMRKTNPDYGRIPENRPKEKKGLSIMDGIAEDHVLSVDGGDKEDRERLINRIEGKAVSRTENSVNVGGVVEHKGFQIEFKQPQLVKGETLEAEVIHEKH